MRIAVADYNAKETLRAHNALASLRSIHAGSGRGAAPLSVAVRAEAEESGRSERGAGEAGARSIPNSKWRLDVVDRVGESFAGRESDAGVRADLPRLLRIVPERSAGGGMPLEGDMGPLSCGGRRTPADMLRAHLRMFPGSDYAPAALYFLAGLSEGARDSAASARLL